MPCSPRLWPHPSCAPLPCPSNVSRRWCLTALGAALLGCAPLPGPVRLGAHVWPGYELLYLARSRGWLDARHVLLIETPTASASLRALASHALEGAALTLDEVLTALDRGIALTVVAVVDVSDGADVVLAQPGLQPTPQAPDPLRGRRVGVEPGATGMVMLDAWLRHLGLTLADIHLVPLGVDEHAAAFRQGRIDAVVTYEPVRSQLLATGARELFSSHQVPDRIVDVLAMRPQALVTQAQAVRKLVAAHFLALHEWQTRPAQCAPLLAPRLGVAPADVAASYQGMTLPDVRLNQFWLHPQGRLLDTAQRLMQVMLGAGLLSRPVELTHLGDARFLPHL